MYSAFLKLLKDPAFKQWPPFWRILLLLGLGVGLISGVWGGHGLGFYGMVFGFFIVLVLKTLADLFGLGGDKEP